MSKKLSLDEIDNLASDLDDDVLIEDELLVDDDLIGDEIASSQSEAAEKEKQKYQLNLPVSGQTVRYEAQRLDPKDCVAHPLNQRALIDHNRITLKERIASFKRIGQQEPVLVIMVDGIPNIIDGYGRVMTWLFCREDEPENYHGNVLKAYVINEPDLVTNQDIIELSKTANESELLSDWNKAVMYQNMLDTNVYPDLKTLCLEEGINYEVWVKNIKLATLPRRYTQLFIKTAHIPKTFSRKVAVWESLLEQDKKAAKVFDAKLNELTATVAGFVQGKIDKPPYELTKPTGVNALIKQLEECVPKPEKKRKIVKEKDLIYQSKDISFTARKARNNTFSIKFDKCSDEVFSKVMEVISEATGAKEVKN